MQPLFRRRGPVILGACILVAFGLAAVVLEGDNEEIAYGQIYSTEEGDPIDLFADAGDEHGEVCMSVGGSGYDTSTSCTDTEAAGETGSWILAIPESEAMPSIAVGVMPAGATRAVAVAGSQRLESEARGRWFLAEFEPGSVGPNDTSQVDVEFAE